MGSRAARGRHVWTAVGVLVLGGLAAALLGPGEASAATPPPPPPTPPPTPPSGQIVGEGSIDGVAYQIRHDAGGYQGHVEINGEWMMLDDARGPHFGDVLEQIKTFVYSLGAAP